MLRVVIVRLFAPLVIPRSPARYYRSLPAAPVRRPRALCEGGSAAAIIPEGPGFSGDKLVYTLMGSPVGDAEVKIKGKLNFFMLFTFVDIIGTLWRRSHLRHCLCHRSRKLRVTAVPHP